MTLGIVLVLIAALSLILILRITVRSRLQISKADPGSDQIQAIDLDAFRNLADPAEDDYLRRKLSSSEYRRVRRVRLSAMAAYVQTAAQNAALLINIGQAALHSSNPQTVEAARELVNDALLLRRNATVAMVKIYVAVAWPKGSVATTTVLDGYRQLNGSAMLLGRLQNPGSPVRISA